MAAQTLRAALSKAESSHPGITYDLIMGIIRRAELNLDMNESVLRLQGTASDYDGEISIDNFYRNYFALMLKLIISVFYSTVLYLILFITKFKLSRYVLSLVAVVEYRSARSEDAFQELNRKSTSLKRILSRIPDEITDRKTFLETIKFV